MISRRIWIVALMLAVAAHSGCRRYNVSPVSVPGVRSLPIEALSPTPAPLILPPYDKTLGIYKGLNREVSVVEFYRMMSNYPVWIGSGMHNALADSMLQFIQDIRFYGLLPQNYHEEELTATVSPEGSSALRILRRDVLLTDAFLSIAKDLRSGVLRQQPPGIDSLQRLLLASVVRDGGLTARLETQEPQVATYKALKNGLRVLLDTLVHHERELLLAGVTFDSIASHATTQAIEINLERWRWEKFRSDRYIFINVPSFTARVFSGDTLVFESRVIVGRPENPTPQLSSSIQCFIVYPYWYVPRKIAIEELLPVIKNDRGYLAKNNFDVLDRRGTILHPDSLEWEKFNKDNFPVALRQREGTDNSLGVLKFVFDNPFAVFLHDTNARKLFRHSTRAYSHGCIRMEKAVDFAHYLVTGELGKKSPALEKYLDKKQRHTVDLQTPIDIHVRYFTAGTSAGQLTIFQDLYKKDRALVDSLHYRRINFY